MLQGCITALVTPMAEDGTLDWESLTQLVEWQIASGVTGLCLVGTTGEAATLSRSEKIAVIRHVLMINHGRVTIIVGCGSASTADTLDFVAELNQIEGIDYIMCLTPYYTKPTQEGLYLHFGQIASASRYPLILYNVPGRTACNLSDKTILRLSHNFPNIRGLKDATGDVKRCLYLLAHKPDAFSLLSGDDESALAFMLCGGNGVISVVSNVQPELMSKLCASALANERQMALAYNQRLLPLYSHLFVEANPIPVKWALYYQERLKSPMLRLPLTCLSQAYQERLQDILVEFQ